MRRCPRSASIKPAVASRTALHSALHQSGLLPCIGKVVFASVSQHVRVHADYLGHRDPRHTARYTRTVAGRAVAACLCLGGLDEAVDALDEAVGDLRCEPSEDAV